MNSYSNLKKLFKKELVLFNKVESKYVVRAIDTNEVVGEFYSIENYSTFMNKNLNPYCVKFFNEKDNFLKYFNLDNSLFENLDNFMKLSLYLHNITKELISLKAFENNPSNNSSYIYLYLSKDYKEINSITIFLLDLSCNDDMNVGTDYDKVVYDFKSGLFYINDKLIDSKDIKLIIENKKNEFKNKVYESLEVRTKKIKDFINEYQN